jgi:hypothetical protein
MGNLTQVVRYTNNIGKLAGQLKDLIFEGKTIRMKMCVGDGVSLYRDKDEWFTKYYELQPKSNIVILAYTNEEVRIINARVRRHLFGSDSATKKLGTFEEGEVIMFNNFYTSNDKGTETDEPSASSTDSEEEQIPQKYYTSYQVHIRKCIEAVYPIPVDKMVKLLESDLEIRSALTDEIKVKQLSGFIEKIPKSVAIFRILTEDDVWIYNPIKYGEYADTIQKCKEEFQKIQHIFSDEAIMKWWEFYYEQICDRFCDITYGYCMTVHKSQGSTFERVFIQMNDIATKNPKERESYQCLYTAVTRASKEIHVFY